MRFEHFGKFPAKTIIFVITALIFSLLSISCGSSSSSDGGTSAIPLSSPKAVSVTPKSGSLDLVWTKVAPIQGVEATYEVWYGTEESLSSATMVPLTATIAGNHVSLTIPNLQNDITYYIRVRSVYPGFGKAEFSSAFTGAPIGKPPVPQITDQGGWENMLEAVWEDSPYATEYKIYWKKDGTGTEPPADASVKKTTRSRTLITGIDNGDTYRIWVQATNTAGDSAYTFTDASSQPADAVPSVPDNITVTGGGKALVVTWNAASQAARYKLAYSATNDIGTATEITVSPDSGTVTAKIPELTNGQLYYVWIQAVNSMGVSAFSELFSGTPVSKSSITPINYSDMNFRLGKAEAEYIWAEQVPESVFFPDGRFSDRLSRFRETAVGNLFCDGAAWYVRDQHEPVDFVFLNGGYIEGPIAEGEILLGKVVGMIDPEAGEDTLVVLTLKGNKVIELFKQAAAVKHSGRGNSGTSGWGIVSSEIRYTIQYRTVNPAMPPTTMEEEDAYRNGWIKPGTLKFNGEDIDPNKSYRIATTSWLADAHDSYLAFLSATNRVNYPEYFWQVVAHYIYEMDSISPYTDGRIYLIGGVPLQAPGWEPGPLWVPGDLNWTPPYNPPY